MKMEAFFIILCSLVSTSVYAGIMPATTRIIYQEADHEKTLMLVNTNKYPIIVQTWADNGEGNPESTSIPFIILPAVFRLLPGETQGVRIVYNREELPKDRESLFWLNFYEIPPATEKQLMVPRLTLAMNTQIKLFWRPDVVTILLEDAVKKLKFTLVQKDGTWSLQCDNPTQMHISFTAVSISGADYEYKAKPQADMMVRPFSKRTYLLTSENEKPDGNNVIFHYLDDNGSAVEYSLPLHSQS